MSRAARHAISIPWLVGLCAWVAFIWGNSLVVGELSDAGSTSVAGFLEPLFRFMDVQDPHMMNYLVRKAAHASEYALFGLLDGLAFGPSLVSEGNEGALTSRLRVLALAILVLVPVADETIQRFVPGRAGNPTDVLIDLAGASIGFIAAIGIAHVTNRGEGYGSR